MQIFQSGKMLWCWIVVPLHLTIDPQLLRSWSVLDRIRNTMATGKVGGVWREETPVSSEDVDVLILCLSTLTLPVGGASWPTCFLVTIMEDGRVSTRLQVVKYRGCLLHFAVLILTLLYVFPFQVEGFDPYSFFKW